MCRYGLPGPQELSQTQGSANSGVPLNALVAASAEDQSHQVVAVHWAVDEVSATVSLKLTLIAHPAALPFLITPSNVALAGNSSARFSVSFSSSDAMLHEGYLLGTQRVISASEPTLRLHCSVLRDAGSSERIPIMQQGIDADSEQPKHAGHQTSDVSSSMLVSCQISGGFHPHAAPPSTPLQPLRAPLKANVIQPHLEPEFPDATNSLTFTCHATDDPATHPSYTQCLVLTNMHTCPLQFALSIPAETSFCIVKAVPSSVSRLPGLHSPVSSPTRHPSRQILPAAISLLDTSITLQPYEHVTVHVRYMPQQQPATAQGMAEAAADASSAQAESTAAQQHQLASGKLQILYCNGQLQLVPMQATWLLPAVQPKVAKLDLGRVHLHSPLVLQLEFSNPTQVDATWSARVEGCSRAGDSGATTTVSFAGASSQAMSLGRSVADGDALGMPSTSSNVFLCSPAGGVMPGRGLAMPQKVQLHVRFAPSQIGAYSAMLLVHVAKGRTVKVPLSGQGTLTEADEVQAQLKAV